ncbi:hypothetical protein HDV02_001756 [Globomyces sp. JEL0801]|nr:hypothetical protein HDV02_001756 [Globomyces sp. JEL0801]
MSIAIICPAISIGMLLLSFLCDAWKRSSLSSPPILFGILVRIGVLFHAIFSLFYIVNFEKYASFVEQKISIESALIRTQLAGTFSAISGLGLFYYYWLSMATLLPKAKVLQWLKDRTDRHPYIFPTMLAFLYIIFVGFLLAPLVLWPEQRLRFYFWRQFIQAIIQITVAFLLFLIVTYLCIALVNYVQATAASKKGVSKLDNASIALVRIIIVGVMVIIYLVLTPSLNLVLDRTLLFQTISPNHPIYNVPCPKFQGWYWGLTGAIISMITLGNQISVLSSKPQTAGNTSNTNRT